MFTYLTTTIMSFFVTINLQLDALVRIYLKNLIDELHAAIDENNENIKKKHDIQLMLRSLIRYHQIVKE